MTRYRPISSRRSFLAGLAAAAASAGVARAAPASPGVAITVDDFNLADDPLMSGEERDTAIRRALAERGLQAAAFPDGRAFRSEIGPAVLARWSEDGHVIGNHSFSHSYFEGDDAEAYMADILRLEPMLASYPRFERLFRYPYLNEGATAAGRDALRALLRAHGYRVAPVTIDTSDWYVNGRLRARLEADPDADLAPYRDYYLEHLWERATFYDALAQDVLGHSLDHTILLHHLLTTGLFLADALAMFEARGWRLVDAGAALAAPELSRSYDTMPAGQSLVWAAAKAHGGFEDRLRYPGEDSRYEAEKMDALGL